MTVQSTWYRKRLWKSKKNHYFHAGNHEPRQEIITRMPAFWVAVKVANFEKLPTIQILKFCNKVYTRHTFWNSLIRCLSIKWIQPQLQAPQSGHRMRDGRRDGGTDGQMDGRTEWNQYTPQQLHCARGINIHNTAYSIGLPWYRSFSTEVMICNTY